MRRSRRSRALRKPAAGIAGDVGGLHGEDVRRAPATGPGGGFDARRTVEDGVGDAVATGFLEGKTSG
jgi:hypothetical protein